MITAITKILILFSALNFSSDIKDDSEKIINEFFNKNVKLVFEQFQIPSQVKKKIENECHQKFYKDYVYLWKIYDGNKKIAVAMLDNVYGKSLPITFLVIFDLDGRILDAEIIKYREPYGGAVQEKKWLNQFIGKNSDSQYKLGKDINSISGATISANSVSTGIKKLTILYSLIKDEK